MLERIVVFFAISRPARNADADDPERQDCARLKNLHSTAFRRIARRIVARLCGECTPSGDHFRMGSSAPGDTSQVFACSGKMAPTTWPIPGFSSASNATIRRRRDRVAGAGSRGIARSRLPSTRPARLGDMEAAPHVASRKGRGVLWLRGTFFCSCRRSPRAIWDVGMARCSWSCPGG